MDKAKLKVLQEVRYAFSPTCGRCQHGRFDSYGRSPVWGTCEANLYQHEKHTGAPREMSIHLLGSCSAFKATDVAEAGLGSFAQFTDTDDRAQRSVAFDALAQLVREDVLLHPEKHSWTLQGFGMLRTYLSLAIRIHVWDSRFRVPSVTDIHDHPWDFESLVLRGSIRNIRYEVREVDPKKKEQPSAGSAPYLYNEGRILCGPAPMRKGAEEIRPILLSVRSDEVVEAGQTYRMTANEVHRSVPEDGTVTMCRRVFTKPDTERARVYWAFGSPWISAEPRAATPEEVEAVCKDARAKEWR